MSADIKITNAVYKNYNKYVKWYDRMVEKGFSMDPRAEMARESIIEFNQRYKDLVTEYHEVKKFKNTPLEELKSRSFAGGSRKQVNAYYATLKEGMDTLKEQNPSLYAKLNEKYDWESYEGRDLAYMEMKGAGLVNKDRYFAKNGGQGGIFDLLYMDIVNEAGIKMTWNSPD